MSILVIALRTASLLLFPILMLLISRRGERQSKPLVSNELQSQLPVYANFLAFAPFLVSIVFFSGDFKDPAAIVYAVLGCLLAFAGTIVVFQSRVALGRAWSLVPKADQSLGLVTTGPYSIIRHPIYSGLTLLAAGQAVTFHNWIALAIVLFGVVPTFAWRAKREDKLLGQVFGDDFIRYKARTKMFLPYLL